MELETIFWEIDDFCRYFEPIFQAQLIPSERKKRIRPSQLCLSEIMTIIIYFHGSSYRNFKDYYQKHIRKYCQNEFPKLVSYQRFIELMPNALMPEMLNVVTKLYIFKYSSIIKGKNVNIS
jgi:hypothetical protein